MKKLSNLILGLALVAATVSCEKSSVEPLTGKYGEANLVEGVTLTNAGVEEMDGMNVFTLSSSEMLLQLVSYNWYPSAGSYTVAAAAGNSVLLAASTIGGKNLDHGGITVYKDGDDYEFIGTVWLSDDSIVKVKAKGHLEYQEVIVEPEHYYTLSPYSADNGSTGWNIALTDLSGNFAANFVVMNGSGVTGDYLVTSDTANLKDGDALVGFDLSFFIPGLIGGCYFDEGGSRWFIQSGTVTVSGSEDMYSVFVTDMVAADAAGQTYNGTSVSFANAIKANPRDLVFEGWSCTYKADDNTEAGTTTHTLSLKNAEGTDAGQVVITTGLLGGITGSFSKAGEDGMGYTAGMDLSAFGMGIVGSYVNVEGGNQMISGGTMTISSAGGRISLSISKLESTISNTASISFPEMELVKEEEPVDPPVGSDSMEIKDGKYTYSAAPKEGVDGVTEHTFSFTDASGNAVGNFVCWTATDAPAAGFYTYAAATETAIGSYAGGLDFFGLAILGSYFVKDGVNYLLQGGTAILTQEDGKVSLLISEVSAVSTDGTASPVKTLYFGDMTADTGEVPTFAVDSGKYTYVSAPKEGVDGVTEHTFAFSDAEGNAVGNFVCWTATDAPAAGFYTYAEPTATAIGSYAGGMDFFGIAILGSYFVQDGNSYLISAGNAILAEEDGKVSLLITDLAGATTGGDAAPVQVLSFSNMTKAE